MSEETKIIDDDIHRLIYYPDLVLLIAEWKVDSKTNEMFFNGNSINYYEVMPWIKENKIDLDTEEGKLAFKLRW